MLLEQNEDCLDYITDQEESLWEKILNRKMERNFSNLFEVVGHERSLILLLSLTDPGLLKQSKFTDDEMDVTESFAIEKLHHHQKLKEYVAMDFLEKQFSF